MKYELPIYNNRKEIPEYSIWKAMRARCYAPSTKNIGCYQSKGIIVCDRWNDFILFYNDMGPRPSNKHSIDRKDNNGNYEPSNCKWETKKVQMENRGTFNRIYTHDGKTMVLKEWARYLNMNYSKLHKRITVQKLPFEEAISKVDRYKSFEINGVSKFIKEWCKIYNISYQTVYLRMKRGLTLIEALTTPIKHIKKGTN